MSTIFYVGFIELNFGFYLIFSIIYIESLSLHLLILLGTKLLDTFKTVSLKIETCISIFLLRKGFFKFIKFRTFGMLDVSALFVIQYKALV